MRRTKPNFRTIIAVALLGLTAHGSAWAETITLVCWTGQPKDLQKIVDVDLANRTVRSTWGFGKSGLTIFQWAADITDRKITWAEQFLDGRGRLVQSIDLASGSLITTFGDGEINANDGTICRRKRGNILSD